MSTPNYDINYNDERFAQVESDKKEALTELENTYGGMIGDADKYYQSQIDASKQWAEQQKQQQQANTDFAIEKIEQQKTQAHKDYVKEQAGAYTDWQKQSNQYGAKAEQMAAQGFVGSGYSESSQVSMYNTYQNRVATARESYNNAVLNYNNAIKDAQLQNNSALAEIAYKALQQELELSLQGFQYKNQLLLDQASKKQELENTYYGRYQDVLDQINKENSLKEQIRQYEQNLALEKEQLELEKKRLQQEQEQWEKEYQLQLQQASASSGGGSSRSYSSGGSGSRSKTSSTKASINKSNTTSKTSKTNKAATNYIVPKTNKKASANAGKAKGKSGKY